MERAFDEVYYVPLLCSGLNLGYCLLAFTVSLTLRTVVGQQLGTNFYHNVYCHRFGSHDVIGHVTKTRSGCT